jgi:hypothetical protein
LRIAQATSIDLNEKNVDKLRRIATLEKDYISWFEYYFPAYAKKKCAKFHKEIANAIIKRKKIKALFEAYRSSGKSVHIDMGIPLYLYLAKKDLRFMLLVGETDKKGKALISGIQAELQHNNRIKNDYGKKFQHGDWSEGNFIQYLIEGLFAMSEFVNDFDSEGDERGYYIPVVASKRTKIDKFQRIEGLSDFFERRNVFFNEAEKDNADQILLRDTFLAFEKGAKIPLDGLDATQGAFAEVNQCTFVAQFEIKTTPRVRKYRY